MGIRFHKSIKILPGVKINLSKKGIGASVGVKGAHVSTGPAGPRSTVSIPGTGFSVTNYIQLSKYKSPKQMPNDLRDFVISDIKSSIRIYNDCIDLILNSNNPKVINGRIATLYEMLTKLGEYQNAGFHTLEQHPLQLLANFRNSQDEIVEKCCERYYMDQWLKIPKFKSTQTQIDHWLKFIEDLDYFYKITKDWSKIDVFSRVAKKEVNRLAQLT